MRKEFSKVIEALALVDKRIIVISGDLGFMAFEKLQAAIGNRFINGGVSEQNIISMAASLASEGLHPICYSIAPFMVFRPAEQIRIDVCLHNMNVKIVGNGGGYGYGIMGATHHAIEDIAVISSFQNMKCYIPFCNEDVQNVLSHMMSTVGPGYLRLGFGEKPKELPIPEYGQIRRLLKGNRLTIVGMGPIILNVFKALNLLGDPRIKPDVLVVSEMPVIKLSEELRQSVSESKKILVLEEHVRTGGLGVSLFSLLLEDGVCCQTRHIYSNGYLNGLYGSQEYHQSVNGLDVRSIMDIIREFVNE